MAKFTDHLILLDLSNLLNSCCYKLCIIIEVSLYCCDKLTNFGTNMHKPELYLLSFGCFLFSMESEKAAK